MTEEQIITIEMDPLDTLFFRDAKPFSLGEDTWADGVFPPSPSVIYGALRSAYFSKHIEKYEDLKKNNQLDTDQDPTNKFRIHSIFFKTNGGAIFPLPLDCVKKQKPDRDSKGEKKICYPMILKKKDVQTNYEPEYFLIPEKKICYPMILKKKDVQTNYEPEYFLIPGIEEETENIENGIIGLNFFNNYLKTNTSKDLYYQVLSQYIDYEPKTGIGRDKNKHVSKDGHFYRINMIRCKENFKFGVSVSGLKYEDMTPVMKLGADGKTVAIAKIESPVLELPELKGKKKFKLYLSTPAIFKNGWFPDWADLKSYNKYNGINIKLISAVTGRPAPIGGFDMKNNCPKPLRKAVPAGSVFYFKTENEIDENIRTQLLNIFHGKSISDEDTAKQGFGISYLGGVT